MLNQTELQNKNTDRSRLAIIEEQVLQQWREKDVFKKSLELNKDGDPWVFWEGPPTANGKPGSHHVLARVFKDVFCRFQTMNGKNVQRKAGWDCHGLPVELGVEKALGLETKHNVEKYGLQAFNQNCRNSVEDYLSEWNDLTERVGYWVNTDNPYKTMDKSYMESVWSAFQNMWNNNLVYHAHRVAAHCPRCETTLSSHEVQQGYKEVKDLTLTVMFKVNNSLKSPLKKGDNLLSWTTTPWTLPNNTLLAVGENFEYLRVKKDNQFYVMVKEAFLKLLDKEAYQIVGNFTGKELVGVTYDPVFDFVDKRNFEGGQVSPHSVVTADFVNTETGTGLVHLAPAFGEDDYQTVSNLGLPVVNSVLYNGTFNLPKVAELHQKFVRDCSVDILKMLQEKEMLFSKQNFDHKYPHCWRCSSPLLYYAKSSWYLKTSHLREEMVKENQTVSWRPEHIKEGRFGNWLENNNDWAVSRERYWGTPLPVWVCDNEKCKQQHCVGSSQELEDLNNVELTDLHRENVDDLNWSCANDNCTGMMRRVEEVLDVWFDSGCMPFAQHAKSANDFTTQADYICEALDQTRGWFYSLMAVSTLLGKKSPYKNVLCLGLLLDESGQKMSKSKGNVVDPWQVINEYGSDALRLFFFASKQPWDGYRFSSKKVGEHSNPFFNTLYNTLEFLQTYQKFETNPTYTTTSSQHLMDQWLNSRIQTVFENTTSHLENFDVTSASRELQGLVEEISNWYVRLNRERFWEGDRNALQTLKNALQSLALMMAPICPFFADHMWQELVGGRSVHLQKWQVQNKQDKDLEKNMSLARQTVKLGLAARATSKIKLRQPLQTLTVLCTEDEEITLKKFQALILQELNIKKLLFASNQDDMMELTVKPNFKTLGPKLGKNIQQFKNELQKQNPQKLLEQLKEQDKTFVLNDMIAKISEQDLIFETKPKQGLQLETDNGRSVVLNTNLTKELKQEGLYRELVRLVQSERKKQGLKVEEKVDITLSDNKELFQIVKTYEKEFKKTVLAKQVHHVTGKDLQDFKVKNFHFKMMIKKV